MRCILQEHKFFNAFLSRGNFQTLNMKKTKLILLNLLFWKLTAVTSLIFETRGMYITLIASVGVLFNLFALLQNLWIKRGKEEKIEPLKEEKAAVMSDLDNELKRRKNEDIILRN